MAASATCRACGKALRTTSAAGWLVCPGCGLSVPVATPVPAPFAQPVQPQTPAAAWPELTPGGPCAFCHQSKPDLDVCYLQVIREKLSWWGVVLAFLTAPFGVSLDQEWQKQIVVLQCRCCDDCYHKGRRIRGGRRLVLLLTILIPALFLVTGGVIAVLSTVKFGPGELPFAVGLMFLLTWVSFAVLIVLYPFLLGRLTRRRVSALADLATDGRLKAINGGRDWGWRIYLVMLPDPPEDEDYWPFE